MKLKKKAKRIIIVVLIIAIAAIGFVGYNVFFSKPEVAEAKVLKTIKNTDIL